MIWPDAEVGPLPDQVTPPADIPHFRRRKRWNGQRCRKVIGRKATNQDYRDQLQDYLDTKGDAVAGDALCYLLDFRTKLNYCCHYTLFREHLDNGAKTFIGAHTCKHKLCAVCNAERAKQTRQTYRSFFDTYPELMEQYDFMHLTLTVPHTTGGFRGKYWYGDELMKEFNYMRKKAFWKRMVYAGEFGVEVTRNDSGLHIHIHALLLVHKSRKNRNALHRNILKAWNKQTGSAGTRQALTEEEQAAILKGNSMLTPADVAGLDPTGATFIGLESLYVRSNEAKPGYRYCDRAQSWKKYVSPKDGADIFMAGILECIKYHFEPMALRKDGTLDFDLIAEVLPSIKGKPLYRKFGAFHSGTKNAHEGAQTLNINYKEDSSAEDMSELLAEYADDEVLNPETGEPQEVGEYVYFVTNGSKVHVDESDDYAIRISPNVSRTYLRAPTAVCAIMEMEQMAINAQITRKRLTPPPPPDDDIEFALMQLELFKPGQLAQA